MTDKEKVVKELDEYIESALTVDSDYVDCVRTDLLQHTVALLKEWPEIVRCEDCKHRPTYPEAYGAEIDGKWCYWCELHRSWKHDDWFCADGERKDK